MEEWIKCPLGDILNFRRGHDLPKTSMVPGDIPVAGSNGIIGFHNVSTPISPCITIGRSGNVGTPYIYDICWAHNTVLYIDDYKGNDPKYLYYLLKTLPLASFGGGSAVPTLNRNHIHPMEVIFCKDTELQKKIAGILSKIDDKIELNRQINDNLEQQAQALYKSWFVDFEPFKDGEFIESELGQIPEGWQCIPFSMFVSESKAKTGKIGIKEYSVTNNGIFPRDAKYNKSLSQSSTKNKLILYGDLVFGMSRDILNWGVMQEEQGGVSSAYTVYNINSGIVNSTYLELFIKSRIHLFSDLIRPAAREGQGIDKSVLQTKVLLCPPQEVLDTFWPLYNSVTNQIQRTTTEINCLGDVRDTLLPKLMSGELEINEIDC